MFTKSKFILNLNLVLNLYFMMDSLIREFPEQLREAIEIGEAAKIKKHKKDIHHVLVCGLGGSGIGGTFVKELIEKESNIPVLVNKGYNLPGYVGENTLAIFSSYSGNTEETLIAFEKALTTKAKIVCISSGGKLVEIAKERGLDYIQLPSGKPSPRACMGYSIVQQLYILNKLNIISDDLINTIPTAADLLADEQGDIMVQALEMANHLNGKIPIIYTTEGMEAPAVRLRQQINENSKMLCWHHVIPEMNHNELVGWCEKNEQLVILYLRNKSDLERNQIRIGINQDIIKKYAAVHEVFSKGNSKFEQMMYHVHFGDWLSWYLSELREGVDAVEIEVINYLKGELAKH